MREPASRRALSTLAALALLLIPAALPAQESSRAAAGADRQAGIEAFHRIAEVLRHPRCLNCHTVTNFPRQGDDRHPHTNLVRRGVDNKGVPGQLCSTCHQAENNASSGVPGRPDWHLSPLSMAWEGLSDGALCRALKDPRRNGGRNVEAIKEHLAHDKLVDHGWDPGPGRTIIPIPRDELVALTEVWARAGAPCPSVPTAR